MSDFSSTHFFLLIIVSLVVLATFILLNALLLHSFTKLFKFKVKSFKKALYSVLIGFGVNIAFMQIFIVLMMENLHRIGNGQHVLSVIVTIAAQTIAVQKFYKVSVGKSFGVSLLSYLAALLSFVVILVLLVFLFQPFFMFLAT